MPGVDVITRTRSGPTAFTTEYATTMFLAGLTERGPTDEARRVRSLAEFEEVYGERVSYGWVWDTVRTYFEEGGTDAVVCRVVGPAPSTGTLALEDQAGTPLDTIRLDALGAGAWSTRVSVSVSIGDLDDSVTLRVFFDGTLVETYANKTTVTKLVNAINQSSTYIAATDLGSATAAPDNLPGVLASTALSAGADDRLSIGAGDYVDALDALAGDEFGSGVVCVPGQAPSAVRVELTAHAVTYDRLALVAPPVGSDKAAALSEAAGSVGSEYLGMVFPWVKVPDGDGGVRITPPEGYAAGVRSRAQLLEGPWRAPAGEIAAARFVVGPETVFDRADGDALDAARVSVIRVIGGSTRLYGWRSMSADEQNYAMLTGRDVLNFVAVEGARRLEQYVFRTIDGRGRLFSEIGSEMIGLVEPMRTAGGLYERIAADGSLIDPGYDVDTGPSVNTPVTLQANEARVNVAVRVSPTGALIVLTITKVGLTAAL